MQQPLEQGQHLTAMQPPLPNKASSAGGGMAEDFLRLELERHGIARELELAVLVCPTLDQTIQATNVQSLSRLN